MSSTPEHTPPVSPAVRHFWYAGMFAVIATPILGILGMVLMIVALGAGNPVLDVILTILFGPAMLASDVAPEIPIPVLYFLTQFPCIWLIAFLVMRAYSRLTARTPSARPEPRP